MSNDFPLTVITADGTFQGRFKEGEDVIEVAPEYITLEPNYEQTAKFLGEALCQGSHEAPYLALFSILDQMRYLTQTDLPAALRVVNHFKELQDRFGPKIEWDQPTGEDAHLEADYEDRYLDDFEM